MIRRGDVTWVDFGTPRSSQPAKVRPAVVMQADWLLATAINTVLVVPLTSNAALGSFPGNVVVPTEASGLEKESVALVSQLGPVSREFLDPYPIGHLPVYLLTKIADGIRLTASI